MFGPVIQQHNIEEVFNTATVRGFFDVGAQSAGQINTGQYDSFSAKTGSQYTLSSNWSFCGAMISGTTTMILTSGATTLCSPQRYSPVTGDLLAVTYGFSGPPNCNELSATTMSQTLFYQVTGGNTNSSQTNGGLTLTVDRKTPNFVGTHTVCATVRVYPNPADNPMTTSSIYSANSTTSYWCDSTLSFNDCCSISTNDVKIWNMNINWTKSVAGAVADTDKDNYGSSGYCGTKEYFGYNSNEGQTFEPTDFDDYHTNIEGGTWYYDSGYNTRVVEPEEQKCIGILHYTNDTTTDFYGEKFSMKVNDYLTSTTIGEAKNFKLHLPHLMWHKKHIQGSGTGTGLGDETRLGQTFYVNPPNGNTAFGVGAPNLMLSTLNANLNNDGLRYYYLTDDNKGLGLEVNIVGKVYPDYKMVIIDDEELLAAMTYKSNRSYTLPVPVTSQLAAGTSCASGCTNGILNGTIGDRLYITYILEDSVHGTTGMHCNKYIYEEYSGQPKKDVSIKFEGGFPYLGLSGGCYADKIKLLYQVVSNGTTLDPTAWKYKDVTHQIVSHTSGQISATNLVATTFYLTGNDIPGGGPGVCAVDPKSYSAYTMNDFVSVSTTATDLQFGDEYFFYGSLETDIMATIYEMRHVVQLGTGEFDTSLNPTWVDYSNGGGVTERFITEIGLYDNENGVPDLMAIAKLQSPVKREMTQQFTITIDF